MMCQWDSLLAVLPQWLRRDVDNQGREGLQELRLRVNAPPELVFGTGSRWLSRNVDREDIAFCVNTASRYSPWAAATIAQGYLTISGGHRIGLCGEAVCRNGRVTGLREVDSLNIRIARDFPGIAKDIRLPDSVLILGAPGWGKTTLLRDLSRQTAETHTVSVVDERGELFPEGVRRGRRMDVLTGCPKGAGIDMVLRTMGPEWIALDEITAASDTAALIQAVGCGVQLMATAHAASLTDLQTRPVYQPLLEHGLFRTILVMNPDKTYREERIPL